MADAIASGDPGPSTLAARRLPIPPKQSQVDAEDLDEALVGMLGERVEKSLANFRGGTSYDLKPELNLVLKLVIFRFGVYDSLSQSSPGSKLQGLRIASPTTKSSRPTRTRLLLYLLLHPPIFPSYILTRLRRYALSKQWPDLPRRDWRRQAWRLIIASENFAKAWELAGWAAFLVDSRYSSLLMRILQLRLIPTSGHLTRLVSYEFMNRQLVWTAFTEFLMFAIPRLPTLPPSLAPSTYIPAVRALLTRPKTVDYTSIALQPAPLKPGDNASRDAHSGPFADLPLSSCPICHRKRATAPVPIPGTEASASIALPPVDLDGGEDEERIFIPAQTDCWGGCRWCYYCIGTELARHAEGVAATQSVGKTQQARKGKKQETSADEAPKWDCLRCGGGVTRAWRVGAELEPMSLEQKEGTDVGGISGTGEPKQES